MKLQHHSPSASRSVWACASNGLGGGQREEELRQEHHEDCQLLSVIVQCEQQSYLLVGSSASGMFNYLADLLALSSYQAPQYARNHLLNGTEQPNTS